MPNEGVQCSRFCFEEAARCLESAQQSINPLQHDTFVEMAAHWKAFGNACDGRVHPWARCQVAPGPDSYQRAGA